ncbi:hypothetical protein ALC62_06344 [Cyphomyrmex costatus]|uniref:Uncharacterized protein n=1 Tax=Cyphomyrmex costatus TaxID=456900 RepID=A0A151IJ05_9HYME|nr:hypothetical protein ALC62_06344 [Cyphomyrmex costatus]
MQYLKQVYGPVKNAYQLQGELGCIYQKNNEDVITYANRVKILGKQILKSYKNPGNDPADQNIKAALEKDMCKYFIRGLKLNGVNKYPVYTLGEITIPLFKQDVTFHLVSDDFPISQSGILGNDFFQQTFSKIDYVKGYLDVSGINIPFFSPETIIVAPRSESLFYVRVENPDVKVGYVPKIKVAHGIYLGDTIVENISGKAYLKVISTLDEEIEVQVPTFAPETFK